MAGKISHGLILRGSWKTAVVVCRSDPHIPHQTRESDHHRRNAKGATELEMTRVILLPVFGDRWFGLSFWFNVALGLQDAVCDTVGLGCTLFPFHFPWLGFNNCLDGSLSSPRRSGSWGLDGFDVWGLRRATASHTPGSLRVRILRLSTHQGTNISIRVESRTSKDKG